MSEAKLIKLDGDNPDQEYALVGNAEEMKLLWHLTCRFDLSRIGYKDLNLYEGVREPLIDELEQLVDGKI